MKILNAFITWFNGKKTVIGLLVLNILQMDLQVWTNMNQDFYQLLLWSFGVLAAGGLTHKAKKALKPKNN